MDQPNQSYSRGAQDKALLAMTIGQAFDNTVSRYPEGEALVVRHQQRRYTWRQLAEAVPGLQAQRQQRPSMQVDGGGQLLPGVAQLLMSHDQRFSLGIARYGVIERLTDGQRQQGLVLRSTAVAMARLGTWLIHDDPYCLY